MGISFNIPAIPECKILTQCNTSSGSILEISSLLKLFNRNNKKFFMSSKAFSKFCNKTKLHQQSEKIFSMFAKGNPSRISIYEILSGIILFSSLAWQQKASLGFTLFDFDYNAILNRDELQMLVCMYCNSILVMTRFKIVPPDLYDELGKKNEESIELNEFLAYLATQSYFVAFLNSSTILPPLVKSLTSLQIVKKNKRSVTPVFSTLKISKNFIDLPSGRLHKLTILTLKSAFDKQFFTTENQASKQISVLIFAQTLKSIPDVSAYASLLEDISIVHNTLTFPEILRLLFSEASEDQHKIIQKWIQNWESSRTPSSTTLRIRKLTKSPNNVKTYKNEIY